MLDGFRGQGPDRVHAHRQKVVGADFDAGHAVLGRKNFDAAKGRSGGDAKAKLREDFHPPAICSAQGDKRLYLSVAVQDPIRPRCAPLNIRRRSRTPARR